MRGVWLPLLCSPWAVPPKPCSLARGLLYAPCVTYSEWYIDELFAVLRNEDARGETALRQVFGNDFWGNPLWGQSWTHKSYRPLAVLSFAWQFRFLGEQLFRPQPLRCFNALLHGLNGLLLFQMLRRLKLEGWAALAAALFAAHPVHVGRPWGVKGTWQVENIVYLVGRRGRGVVCGRPR